MEGVIPTAQRLAIARQVLAVKMLPPSSIATASAVPAEVNSLKARRSKPRPVRPHSIWSPFGSAAHSIQLDQRGVEVMQPSAHIDDALLLMFCLSLIFAMDVEDTASRWRHLLLSF